MRLIHKNPQSQTTSLDERSRQFLNKVSATHNSFAESTIRDLNTLRQQIANQNVATRSFEDLELKLKKLLLEHSHNESIIHTLIIQMRTVEDNIKDIQQDSIAMTNTKGAGRTLSTFEVELQKLKTQTKAQERQIIDLADEQDREREENRVRVAAMKNKLYLMSNERSRERQAFSIRLETLEKKISAVHFGTQITSFTTNIDREEIRHLELHKQQQQKQICADVSLKRIELTFDSIANLNV